MPVIISGRLRFVHLCVASLAWAAPAAAAWPPINELCRDAYLAELKIYGAPAIRRGTDLCARPAGEVPEPFREAISSAGQVHSKVAEVFRLEPASLFPRGVRLQIKAGADALNGYFDEHAGYIELGAPPAPAQWLSAWTYAHELGHWVVASAHPAVPPTLRSTLDSFFRAETAADTIAFAALGEPGAPFPDLPACLVPRLYGAGQSYKQVEQRAFLVGSGAARMQACCESSAATLNANGKAVCNFVAMALRKRAPKLAASFARSPFLATSVRSHPGDYDDHELGTPINAFLFALGQRLGRPVFADFLTASVEHPKQFTCRPYYLSRREGEVKASIYTLGQQLPAFRQGLRESERSVFDELYAQFGLDVAVKLEASRLDEDASFAGARALIRAMRANRGGALNARNPCLRGYESLVKGMPARGESFACDVICRD